MYQVSSFFIEVSTYTTLSQTLIGDILDVWILGSVGRNLIQQAILQNRPTGLISPIFTYYHCIYYHKTKPRALCIGAEGLKMYLTITFLSVSRAKV